jgi:hypothetical protein
MNNMAGQLARCPWIKDLFKTIDGGAHWIECKPLPGDLYNIHFADSFMVYTGETALFHVMLTENNFDTISHFYKNKMGTTT